MKVLVTGGAGYVGSTLITELLEEGHQVVSIDNLSRGDYRWLKEYREHDNLDLKVGDIRDLGTTLQGEYVEAVVHLAAIPGLERCQQDPEKAISTNVFGTYQVLQWARKNLGNRVVFTSSAAVYGVPDSTPITEDQELKPTNLYGVTKLAGEKLAWTYHNGLNPVTLRFGNVYGVGVYTYWETVIPKFVNQAWNHQPLTVYGDGEQSRDFVHVKDIAEAVISTLKAEKDVVEGEAFNVGTGEPVSVNTIAHMVSQIFEQEHHREVEVSHLPPREGESHLPDFCLSPMKIKSKLKFKTRWKLREGIKQLIQYRTQH
ncbi:MAG: NAD-dependent epimerase/dehydratase family protein [Thermoproteota archaeon]